LAQVLCAHVGRGGAGRRHRRDVQAVTAGSAFFAAKAFGLGPRDEEQ